jgi:hypothetical protein
LLAIEGKMMLGMGVRPTGKLWRDDVVVNVNLGDGRHDEDGLNRGDVCCERDVCV